MIEVAVCIALFTAISGKNQKEKVKEVKLTRSGMIKLTDDVADYEKKDYRSIKAIFEGLGFTNVRVINMKDLRVGILTKLGQVESVNINGDEFESDEWYPQNAQIIITYHGFYTD